MTNKRSFVEASLRRTEILGAAKRLFASRGYHATSMRDIAAELDLLGGSLYAHISSKGDMLWELVSYAANRFVSDAHAVEEQEPDPRLRLRRLVEAHVDVVTSDPDNAIVFHHEWRCLSPERREAIAVLRRAYEGYFRRAIADGAAVGIFQTDDPNFAALLPLSLGNWLYQWYRADGRLTPPEISQRFNAMIERALCAPQHPAPEE